MSDIEDKRSVKNAIWITSKVRMLAESKRRFLHCIFWTMALWYEFSSLFVDLFSDFLEKPFMIGMTFSIVGLFLTIASLGLNYGAIAAQFRECYLALDKLVYLSSEAIDRKYYDILDKYPNHTPADYEDFLVLSRIKGMKIVDSLGNTLNITLYTWLSWAFRKFAFWSIVSLVAGFPLITVLLLIYTH